MKFRTAGRLGAAVSEIGLGCWQLGAADWGDVPEADSLAILKAAVDHGVTFIDTADVYGAGRSERLIGQFMRTLPDGGRRLFVATKLGRLKGYPDGYSYDLFRECTLASIDRLGRGPLDLTQLHCVPPAALEAGHVFDWLRRLKGEGLIRHFGASVESMAEARVCLRHPDVDALQIIFNVFRQKPIDELFAEAKEKGVALIVRLPLASGLLAGKYTKATRFAPQDHRSYNANGEKFNVGETFAGLPFEKAVELADQLKPLLGVDAGGSGGGGGGETGPTMADLSMRWILDHDAVTTVIPGASRPAQAAQNGRASELPPLGAGVHASVRQWYRDQVRAHIRGPY
jgi:aryl-alcohol dehydrogenase-like predicted oxidoreductase